MRVLVTGAAKGLGRAITENLLSHGHEVVAVDKDIDGLEDLALKSRGACTVEAVNLARHEDVLSLIRSVSVSAGRPFNMVFLNAGISATGRFEEIPLEAYERLIQVNLLAPLLLASGLVANGEVSKRGKIILISSLSHITSYPGASVYAATKDAIAVYARSVRPAWKKNKIRLLTVYPGPLRTDHAERHAPTEAKAGKRMPPDVLATKILKIAKTSKSEFYPGVSAKLAKLCGQLFPGATARLMRRFIFEKLDQNTFD